MHAFTKGNRKETSPKAHLNSGLNENQGLGQIFKRSAEDQSKIEDHTK